MILSFWLRPCPADTHLAAWRRANSSASDFEQSRRGESPAPQVPDCQLDALKYLCGCCQITIISAPAMPSPTHPLPRASLTGASPEPPRSTSNRRLEVLRGGSGECPASVRRGSGAIAAQSPGTGQGVAYWLSFIGFSPQARPPVAAWFATSETPGPEGSATPRRWSSTVTTSAQSGAWMSLP